MNAFRSCISAALLYLWIFPSPAAAPVNDNFEDRLRLEGTHLEVTGSFDGATLESGEGTAHSDPWGWAHSASVWFSWKAPETGIYLLTPKSFFNLGVITVSTGLTPYEAQSFGNVLAEPQFQTPLHPVRYATFHAQRDTEYVIRASGSGSFEFSIILTNHPIILEQPRTRTTSEGWTAFFAVGAALQNGRLPAFQWQFNGTDLPGQTAPVFTITNVTPQSAGEYSVVATSPVPAGGFLSRTSSIANLFVKPPEKPVLSVRKHSDGGIYVHVENPEVGRTYTVHSFGGLNPGGTSYNLGDRALPLPLDQTYSRQPIKGDIRYLSVRGPMSNLCYLNLQRILFAKHRMSHDRQLTTGASFTQGDFRFYEGEALQCPEGGVYDYNSIGTQPTCTVVGHTELPWYPH